MGLRTYPSATMNRRRYLAVAGGTALSTVVTGCTEALNGEDAAAGSNGEAGGEEDLPEATSALGADVTETVTMQNLELPWDIVFSGTGEVFFTERVGRIRRGPVEVLTEGGPADPDELPVEPVDLAGFVSSWEAGAQGIDLHPDYPDEPYVYVYYTVGEPGEAEDHTNRVIRYDATQEEPEVEILVDEIPGRHIHNGGRIAFGPEDRLWILAGTGGTQELARDPSSLGGAVLRITPDGEPAGADIDGGDPRTVTHGHRNPQGIDWLPDGTPVVAEHGPAQRDELHLLQEGEDYGWNVARNGPADDDYESYLEHDFAKPIASSGLDNTWAPSGGSVYDADAIPEWEGTFLLGGLISHRLHLFRFLEEEHRPPEDAAEIHDDEWLDERRLAVRHELYENEFGRIRHAAVGPDESVYLLTSNTTGPIRPEVDDEFPRETDDVIVRIDPA